MKIGELARATGTQVETIRFYEREGLLPAPARTDGNYRVYDQSLVERLAFIRHCRCLDMTLDEIRALLQYRDAPEQDCAGVDHLLDEHLGHVVRRIEELRALERELRALRASCATGQTAGECGILGGLERAAREHDHAHAKSGRTHTPSSHGAHDAHAARQ